MNKIGFKFSLEVQSQKVFNIEILLTFSNWIESRRHISYNQTLVLFKRTNFCHCLHEILFNSNNIKSFLKEIWYGILFCNLLYVSETYKRFNPNEARRPRAQIKCYFWKINSKIFCYHLNSGNSPDCYVCR